MGKDTKNSKTRAEESKRVEINLFELDQNSEIRISKSQDYFIAAKVSDESITKDIKFIFTNSEIISDLDIKLAVSNNQKVKISATIVIPNDLVGCQSSLSLNGLLLSPNASINFTPSLEINNMNAGADHKSTIGAPNRKHLEYMQSRGLTIAESIELISDSFFS